MKTPTKFALKRAKATLAGRILCRLLGEQTGAVLMEYVVLGVLLVAAVVGAVVMFGEDITGAFKVMGQSLFSKKNAVTAINTERQALEGREGAATTHHQTITDNGN